MLFKRKGKQTENVNEAHPESEEELEIRLQSMLKKQKRRRKLKEVCISILIVLISVGGFKSLFSVYQATPYEQAVNHYAFANEYLQHYFRYPQTETESKYRQLFSLDSAWRCEYDLNHVKRAEVLETEVYNVERETTDGTSALYIRAQLEIVDANEEASKQDMQLKLTIANKDNAFLVVAPIDMVYTQTLGMSDAEKALYAKTKDTSGSDCSDAEKKELQNTIQLFLKTYMSDFEQARLLMTEPDSLDPIDPLTQITAETFSSIRKTDTAYIVDVDIQLITKESLKQRRSYRFIIDQKTNKITEMEEY